jgi:hypothetical protein
MLDRDLNHDALIPASLQSWYATLIGGGNLVLIYDQEDITTPQLSILSQPAMLNLSGVTIDLNYSENSYAVDGVGDGLAFALSGNANCTALPLPTDELTTMT